MLSIFYKIFTKILSNRIRAALDYSQSGEQAGVRNGCSALDQVRVINHEIEKAPEYNQPLHMAFIDHEDTFDSLETPAVMEALHDRGAQKAYVNILGNLYEDSTGTLFIHKKSRILSIN